VPHPQTNEQVQLRVGQRHDVRLPGLGPTGYQWFHAASNANVVVDRIDSAAPGTTAPIGSGVEAHFVIAAQTPGPSRVVFEQARAWQRAAVVATHTVEIEVLGPGA
jgi:predicted secreted protein